MKDFAIRNPNVLFRKELISLEQAVDRLAKGLIGGRIEHESMPDLQRILQELKPFISFNELQQLEQALSNNRSNVRREQTEAAITRQLKVYIEQARLIDPEFASVQAGAFSFFSEREPTLAAKKADSKTSFLIYLRDLALELTTFLQRPIADSLNDFIQLFYQKQKEVAQKAKLFSLSKGELKAANDFLSVSASLVLLEKIQMVADDYIQSGTDIRMANGRIWATRYNRFDYIPFLFDSVEDLEKKYPFSFSTKELSDRLAAVRVRVKAESLASVAAHPESQRSKNIPLTVRSLEIKTLFGLILNFCFSDWQQWIPMLLQILDVKSTQALESDEVSTSVMAQKLSRVRYYVHLFSLLFHDSFARTNSMRSQRMQKDILASSAIAESEKVFSKLKFELEVVGLGNLGIGVEECRHGKLEGLSDWVNGIVSKESSYFRYRLAYELGNFEQAFTFFSEYLSRLLESDQTINFRELNSEIKINPANGAEEHSFLFSAKIPSYDEQFILQIVSLVKNSADSGMGFFKALPILTRLAAEFSDFDKGLSLMLAQRHLWFELSKAMIIPESVVPLVSIIDAEVRFRYGYRKAGATRPQKSAVYLLLDKKPSSSPKWQHLGASGRQLFDQLADQIFQDAISGQSASVHIRHLRGYAKLVKSKSYAKKLAEFVRLTVENRLLVTDSDYAEVSRLFNLGGEASGADALTLLKAKEIESRAVAATKMLLDCSLVCAEAGDSRVSRSVLEFCVRSYRRLLPGLSDLAGWILSADSIEEFRRRIEKGIAVLKDESESDYICLSSTHSGVLLGFMKENAGKDMSIDSKLSDTYELLSLISSIRRRRIIAGRCGVLERYQDTYHAVQRQRIFASALIAVNDLLD